MFIKINIRHIGIGFAIGCTLLISGCADSRNAVPDELVGKAQMPGMPGIRSTGGSLDAFMEKGLIDALLNEDPSCFSIGPDGTKIYSSLAISGGADNGAYGAGVLKGWSKEGSRPVFKAVTGVSTGALIAPFAFLGSAYDKDIEKIYTNISTKDVVKRKGLIKSLFGNSLVSSEPLAKLISDCATDDILNAISREHKKGRRLFIGTCAIDGPRLVIWDMGAIATLASLGNLEAKKLFEKVLLASASIPVTFPPVFIDVEADGKKYTEMHVDGSTLTQVFYTYAFTRDMRAKVKSLGIDTKNIRADLYIIRNGRIMPPYKVVKDRITAIAERAIDILADAQGVGDIYRLYAITIAKGNGFKLAYIPDDEAPEKKEFFDTQAMRELFKIGYQNAASGRAWHSTPPGWEKAIVKREE
jgi:predicted acylesterase/phospholipase RssA